MSAHQPRALCVGSQVCDSTGQGGVDNAPPGPPAVSTAFDGSPMSAWSQTFTFLDGEWLEGNHPIVGARTHAFWLGTSVFDGARAFEGVTPDLDQHCARLNRSAKAMCLKPTMTVGTMLELTREGIKKFRPGAEL